MAEIRAKPSAGADDGPWHVVTKVKGRRRRLPGEEDHERARALARPDRQSSNPEEREREISILMHCLNDAIAHIETTPFLATLRGEVRQRAAERSSGGVWGVVCYGLGHVEPRSAGLWQLACITALLRDVQGPWCGGEGEAGERLVYDPVFDDVDRAVLSRLGWEVLGSSDGGKRGVKEGRHCLFFMPHCPMRLYSNLLWANYSPTALQALVILGNRLSQYEERMLASEREADPSNCILPLLPHVREVGVCWSEGGAGEGRVVKAGERERHATPSGLTLGDLEAAHRAFTDLSVVDFPNVPGEGDALWVARPPEHHQTKEDLEA